MKKKEKKKKICTKGSSEQNSAGWQAIPKPKGHSQLDYSRWDRVDDESSEDDDDEDDDEESQPRYRFRVKTVVVSGLTTGPGRMDYGFLMASLHMENAGWFNCPVPLFEALEL
ncbi:hypothetical protein C3L33_09660, partial [Rhododendron williamsianum]